MSAHSGSVPDIGERDQRLSGRRHAGGTGADPGLQEFVRAMFASNGNDVFPPMQAQDDTIICVTATGIYEYCAGETKQIRQLSSVAAFGNHALNGLLPVCRGQENEYYVCIFGGTGMNLWEN